MSSSNAPVRIKSSKTNHSVGKAMRIIETMAEDGGPMRLQDIADRVDLPPSTAMRFLNTLAVHGYVHQHPETLRYSLSLKLCAIADRINAQVNVRDVIHPHIERLSHLCGESTCLAVEESREVVYVDVVEGPDKMLKTLQRIGKRAPMHCTGVGKTMLLNYPDEIVREIITESGMERLTPNTITDPEHLLTELMGVRSDGTAIDDEECEPGVRCVAAPVRDYTGRVIASISVSGPASRLNGERIAEVRVLTLSVALDASRDLGFIPSDT